MDNPHELADRPPTNAAIVLGRRDLLRFVESFVLSACLGCSLAVADPDTLPSLKDGRAPNNFEEMWAGFDPRDEPLEVELLTEGE